jgi:hypothetical protein
MGKDFTLYWSSLERFENCPQSFLWYRGWGAIDVGGGPGKRKPKPFKDSRHHAVMGIVIGAVTERFYNDELWRQPQGLPNRLVEMTKKEFRYQIGKPRNYIDWRLAPSKADMLQVCQDGVQGFLRTVKANRLLGEYARSEVDLVGYINKWNPVGGRADYIIRRLEGKELPGITILDGKNSKSKGRYTDPDQLRWYAMCFYLAYGRLPDRLGFVYFRYPHGAPMVDKKGEPVLDDDGNPMIEQGVDWVPFTKEDIQGIAQRGAKARKAMDKEQFEPTPTPKGCRFCDYETVCKARQDQKKSRARKPKNTDDLLQGSEGFVEFGFELGGPTPAKGG